jgi:hypothetical protein
MRAHITGDTVIFFTSECPHYVPLQLRHELSPFDIVARLDFMPHLHLWIIRLETEELDKADVTTVSPESLMPWDIPIVHLAR